MTLDELARACRYMKIAYFDYDTCKRLGFFDCHEVHYRNMGLKRFLVMTVYCSKDDQIDVFVKETKKHGKDKKRD